METLASPRNDHVIKKAWDREENSVLHQATACKSLVKPVLRHIAALAVTMAVVATAHGQVIERHETAGIVDLVPGADRGTITQPLLTGTIALTGQEVLFVITDASDKDFAALFGAVRADSLAQAPEAAVETAIFDDETVEWTFFNDPGRVARFDDDGNVLPPVGNPNYSPLKRFEWNGKTVTVNVPFVKWGDGAGQTATHRYRCLRPAHPQQPAVSVLRRQWSDAGGREVPSLRKRAGCLDISSIFGFFAITKHRRSQQKSR